MKFTLSWLKEHLDTDSSLENISETLTRIGLEVEGIEDKAAALAPFVVAHVLTAEQHPNADRLRVCTVDAGDGQPVQVVCGAPNARAGMKTVFAPPGTYVPGFDKTLAVGNIRGVESPRHAVLGRRTRPRRGVQRHPRSAGGRPDRPGLRALCRARRSGHRDQPHSEPPGLYLDPRHRPRSLGCRHRRLEARADAACAWRGRVPRAGRPSISSPRTRDCAPISPCASCAA